MNLVRDVPPFRLPATPQASDLVARYFRALSEPTRLGILELLREESELTVGEIVGRLAVPQPQVSNHLACLRWCGFIQSRRDGRTVYNRIADERVVQLIDLGHALLADNAAHVAACCRIDDPSQSVPINVTREAVQQLVAEGAHLVEVLPREQYEQVHLAGALSIPLKELGRRAEAQLDRARPVITYCNDFL